MPYQPNYVRLQHSAGRTFTLIDDVTFRARGGHRYTARKGLETDIATIPHTLWSVIAPFGRQSLPSIVHDQECSDVRAKPNQRSRPRRHERRAIDARLLDALLEQRVPRFRAAMMWAGVTLGRFWEHGGHLMRLALFTQLFAGATAIVWGLFHTAEWTGWAGILAPAALAAAWGRSAPAILMAQYPGILLFIIMVGNFALSVLEWIPNVILGARWPEGPTEQDAVDAGVAPAVGGGDQKGDKPFRGVGMPPGFQLLPKHPGPTDSH